MITFSRRKAREFEEDFMNGVVREAVYIATLPEDDDFKQDFLDSDGKIDESSVVDFVYETWLDPEVIYWIDAIYKKLEPKVWYYRDYQGEDKNNNKFLKFVYTIIGKIIKY